MPFDLWIRSTANPPVFEPERIALPVIERHYDAMTTAAGYAASDREVFVVEVDDAGRIIDDAMLAATARNETLEPEAAIVADRRYFER